MMNDVNIEPRSEDCPSSAILVEEPSTSLKENIGQLGKKVPRRTIHFSDGVIEEYSTDDNEEEDKKSSSKEQEKINPKTLKWLPWLAYYFWCTGSSFIGVIDNIGERLGWFFGITSPKYYYEIEEFKRAAIEEEKRKKEEKEQNWNEESVKSVVTLDPSKLQDIPLKTVEKSNDSS